MPVRGGGGGSLLPLLPLLLLLHEFEPHGLLRSLTLTGAFAESLNPADATDWYRLGEQTLTPLADGRILISGGASRIPMGQDTLEVYDPGTDQVAKLVPYSGTLEHNGSPVNATIDMTFPA